MNVGSYVGLSLPYSANNGLIVSIEYVEDV